ncbi:amidase [Bacillus sp. S/N-304-OC-R1]|uniref:amidase n=1 Tax=Bacillus sp. S/N-304-OC-R1 TaxID=2758034 RepID=UPI001C8D61BF|nr:amidase family protein [Bacillus sp. S/N-304-OC-R1]MBY0121416.1 amidase [Bacillus sp. S/N-304-OC-R1]
MINYQNYDGLGLAELVAKKEVHPKELAEAAIKSIELKNPKLNAVIHKMYDKALKSAESELKGTFAGVPMLIKDIAQEAEGEPLTLGSKGFSRYRAKADSIYVSQLRRTGALLLGYTNVPEFGLVAVTEPKYYGAAKNPWNVNFTPGGSSGGSAVAVASGMVPIAGANDGGGSIRIPAAYCGLFGLKPTRGRTPVGPKHGRSWQGASVDHVLTKSVRDSAAMLDELSIMEKTAAFHAPPYQGSYLTAASTPLKNDVTFAFSISSPIGTEVHHECKEAVLKTVKILESLGYRIEEADAPVDGNKITNSYLTMYFGETAALIASLEEVLGRKANSSDVEQTTWLLGLLGKATSAEEFVLSLKEWDKAAFKMEEFHETYDFYITPTTAFPPAKIGELDPSQTEKMLINIIGKLKMGNLLKKAGIVDQLAQKNLMRTPYTQLANLTGQPAMSVPLHMTEDGLPVGVQIMAAKGKEDLLFQLAGLLEQTEYWIELQNNPSF